MQLKPTERFSNRAGDYRLHRPGYPAAAAELIRNVCARGPDIAVADIGSGTGIFSRVLLEAGFRVTAVEPNGPMRAVAEQDLAAFPKFRSAAAPAEATGLPDGEFDAITVAQAFHWFDHEAAAREFKRLLRPEGWTFIVWNIRGLEESGFAREYEELMKSLGESHHDTAHRRRHEATGEFFGGSGRFQTAEFDNPHTLDWPGLKGRFLSTSYTPVEGDPRHEPSIRKLEAIFHEHAEDGLVTFPQRTVIFYGRLP